MSLDVFAAIFLGWKGKKTQVTSQWCAATSWTRHVLIRRAQSLKPNDVAGDVWECPAGGSGVVAPQRKPL